MALYQLTVEMEHVGGGGLTETVLEVVGPLAIGAVGTAILKDTQVMYSVVLRNSVHLLTIQTDLLEQGVEIEVNEERLGDHGVIRTQWDIRRALVRDSFEAIPGYIAAVALYQMRGRGYKRVYIAAPEKTWKVGDVTEIDESVV